MHDAAAVAAVAAAAAAATAYIAATPTMLTCTTARTLSSWYFEDTVKERLFYCLHSSVSLIAKLCGMSREHPVPFTAADFSKRFSPCSSFRPYSFGTCPHVDCTHTEKCNAPLRALWQHFRTADVLRSVRSLVKH